jgi:hypothetical protein
MQIDGIQMGKCIASAQQIGDVYTRRDFDALKGVH